MNLKDTSLVFYKKIVPSNVRSFIRRRVLKRDYTLTYEELFKKRRIIFIHIPKTAGISISKALFGRDSAGHQKLEYFESVFKTSLYELSFKFAFVRNPYDRIFSAYNYLLKGGRGNTVDAKYSQIVKEFKNFEDFVERFISSDRMNEIEHFKSQSYWVKNSKGNIDLDFIGKYENLKDDFQTICNKLNIDCQLPVLNSSKKETLSFKEVYTNSMKTIIDNKYSEDFKYFGYITQI